MKVVLFCGGLGTRLGELTEDVPKPLVKIGYRPILWHLMKYYAHYGHKDFILCLGYKADAIKRYFLDYEETLTNDFVLRNGGRGRRGLFAVPAGAGLRLLAQWRVFRVSPGNLRLRPQGRRALPRAVPAI